MLILMLKFRVNYSYVPGYFSLMLTVIIPLIFTFRHIWVLERLVGLLLYNNLKQYFRNLITLECNEIFKMKTVCGPSGDPLIN